MCVLAFVTCVCVLVRWCVSFELFAGVFMCLQACVCLFVSVVFSALISEFVSLYQCACRWLDVRHKLHSLSHRAKASGWLVKKGQGLEPSKWISAFFLVSLNCEELIDLKSEAMIQQINQPIQAYRCVLF